MNGLLTRLSDLETRRRRLGMPKSALARRAGVSLPTVQRILSGRETSPRIANLQAIAATLGVAIRIGDAIEVEETKSAHEFRKFCAAKKAERLVGLVQGTMALEAQAVDAATRAQMVEQTTYELLSGPRRRLWDD